MPVRTELEWAKEICRRQGYCVIQQSRVQELYARNMIPAYDWDVMKDHTDFRNHVWTNLAHNLVSELIHRDYMLRDERDLEAEYWAVDSRLRGPNEPPDSYQRPINGGHMFQSRITVIKYG